MSNDTPITRATLDRVGQIVDSLFYGEDRVRLMQSWAKQTEQAGLECLDAFDVMQRQAQDPETQALYDDLFNRNGHAPSVS